MTGTLAAVGAGLAAIARARNRKDRRTAMDAIARQPEAVQRFRLTLYLQHLLKELLFSNRCCSYCLVKEPGPCNGWLQRLF